MVHIKQLLAVELGYSYDGTVHIHEDDVALEQKFFHGDHPLVSRRFLVHTISWTRNFKGLVSFCNNKKLYYNTTTTFRSKSNLNFKIFVIIN